MHFIRTPRVLVLDDQPVVAESIAQLFKSRGYEAHARCTPAQILDLASDSAPDLLIADVALGPNTINGFDLAIYFRNFYPLCGVILISGDPTTAELQKRALEQGHDFLLLQKPIPPQELLRIAADALAQREKKAA